MRLVPLVPHSFRKGCSAGLRPAPFPGGQRHLHGVNSDFDLVFEVRKMC